MRDLIVRLGWQHNRWVVVLRDYKGPASICPDLHQAITQRLQEKHQNPILDFDFIEILGWE